MSLTLRTISREQHLAYIQSLPSASHCQVPAWADVKTEWRSENLGWFDKNGEIVGAGLVLYRQLPKVKRYLAYLPEGPVLDWGAADLGASLAAMGRHLRAAGAFGARIGPPVPVRAWSADTLKRAIADPATHRLSDVAPDRLHPEGTAVRELLAEAGWREQATEHGFAAGQPRHVFQLRLAGRSPDDVLAGMNQLWRRNIKKAAKLGVEVSRGELSDLPSFHRLYLETAARDRFTPRPLAYFETMLTALTAEDPDRIRLYLARHEGDLVAATTWVRVGTHTWYSYGASSTAKREVRGSNAIQWQMIQDAIAAGAAVYDLRGITDTLDADDPHVGLIQFKVGTGGEAVEYVGEWDLPLNGLLYKAFDAYMRRR